MSSNTRSSRAGLAFPVRKIVYTLKHSRRGGVKRVSEEASVYLTAIEEFICAKGLERATVVAKASKRYTNKQSGEFHVMPRHLDLAAARDPDLARILGLSHLVPS